MHELAMHGQRSASDCISLFILMVIAVMGGAPEFGIAFSGHRSEISGPLIALVLVGTGLNPLSSVRAARLQDVGRLSGTCTKSRNCSGSYDD